MAELDIPVIVKRFKEYVLSECREQLMTVMAHPDSTKHFGIYVRYVHMSFWYNSKAFKHYSHMTRN